jgi:ubiquitin carboxyl-terminal hydrolase 10
LSPRYFYPLLNRFNPKYGTQHVYQEDAQEFLSFLLDRMHEEMLSITKNRTLPVKEEEPEGEEEDWQEVGKGNKTSIIVTKEETFASSPITSIFGGKLRISLKKHNTKSSVSIQPFFCLHLDIQHPAVHTLEDALEFFSTKEFLEGVTDSTNIEVEASKHTTLESLPKTLIIHLKRFSFDEGTQKLGKFISFPNTLTIKPHLVSAKVNANQRKYQLLAVVSHLGTQATNGHYTCDIRLKGQWIHFDDTTVYKTTEEQVASRVAYILLYQQCK